MALDLNTTYPSQTTAPDASYPLGGAQNITTPGDGSGTPWIAPVANDIFGFQQKLLTEAGITPSNVPDNAVDSQYFDALQTVIGRREPVSRTINVPAAATFDEIQALWDDRGDHIPRGVTITYQYASDTYDEDGKILTWKGYSGGGLVIHQATTVQPAPKAVIITGTGAKPYEEFPPYSNAEAERYLVQVTDSQFVLFGDIQFDLKASGATLKSAAILVANSTVSINDCVVMNATTTGTQVNAVNAVNRGNAVMVGNAVTCPTGLAAGVSIAVEANLKGTFTAISTSGAADYGYHVSDAIASYTADTITAATSTEFAAVRGQLYS